MSAPTSDTRLREIESALDVLSSLVPYERALFSLRDISTLIAHIRALETACERKNAALRQAIDILQVQGFPLMADFCRAALAPDETQEAVEKRHASE